MTIPVMTFQLLLSDPEDNPNHYWETWKAAQWKTTPAHHSGIEAESMESEKGFKSKKKRVVFTVHL